MDPTEAFLRNEFAVGIGRTVHPLASGMLQVHRSLELFGNSVGSVGFRAPATAHGPLYVLPASDSQMGTAVMVSDASGNLAWMKAPVIATIGFTFDGGGSVIETSKKAYIRVPWAFTIKEVSILADTTGSVEIDVWATSYTSFPPTVTNTITGGTEPAISSGTKYFIQPAPAGWTTSFASNMAMIANINSVSSITYAVLELTVEKRDFPDGLVPHGPGGGDYSHGSPATGSGDGGAGAIATAVGGRPIGGDYGGPFVCET